AFIQSDEGGPMPRGSRVAGCAAWLLALALGPPPTSAESVSPVPRPNADSIRAIMVIPSHGDVRGRIDSTGYALQAEQMARVWELASQPPAPDSFGPPPAAGV